ncbi:hypothetical protein D3C75_787870 [compost metagenome]
MNIQNNYRPVIAVQQLGSNDAHYPNIPALMGKHNDIRQLILLYPQLQHGGSFSYNSFDDQLAFFIQQIQLSGKLFSLLRMLRSQQSNRSSCMIQTSAGIDARCHAKSNIHRTYGVHRYAAHPEQGPDTGERRVPHA